MPIIATAGHVDHGKSALVRAITGTDPDRLAEEKRRGMTIDLGFAHAITVDGTVLSFVDVPGHSDFVRTMIAGASGVGVVLLVIDAREGWKPQTTEHLAICELLGVDTGVVALTKCDLVDPAHVADLTASTQRELSSSHVEWMGIVPTSCVTNAGVAELTALLGRAVASADPTAGGPDRPRLFVDRVFSLVGSGTVVTGTLDSGTLKVGDEMVSVPGGHRAIVRSIHTHGRSVQVGLPGTRCALNLAHTSTRDIERGEALVIDGQWTSTTVVDASWQGARGVDTVPSNGRGWTMHVGTARRQVSVRMLPLVESSLRLRFDRALPLSPADRFILRHTGTDTTVAGGTVLDASPTTRTTRARPDGSPESILAGRGWITADEALRLTGKVIPAVVGHWVASRETVQATVATLEDSLSRGPVDLVSLDAPEKALVASFPGTIVEQGTVRRGGRNPLFDHPCVAAIRDAGLTPPPSGQFDRDVVRRLVGAGVLFEHDGIAFHVDTLRSLSPMLEQLWSDHPGGFTVSQLREALGITRKHAVPLAECLDRARITKRSGDVRLKVT